MCVSTVAIASNLPACGGKRRLDGKSDAISSAIGRAGRIEAGLRIILNRLGAALSGSLDVLAKIRPCNVLFAAIATIAWLIQGCPPTARRFGAAACALHAGAASPRMNVRKRRPRWW